jgi:hypothetical protein
VQDGAVIASAEVRADLLQRQRRQLAGEVHADLARQQDVPRLIASLQLPGVELKVTPDALGDPLDRWAVDVGIRA